MRRRRPDPPPPTEGLWRLFLAFRLDGGWIAEKLLSLSLTEVMGPDGVGFPVAPETYHRNVSACGLAAAVWRARRDRAGVADLKGDRVCGKTLGKFVD